MARDVTVAALAVRPSYLPPLSLADEVGGTEDSESRLRRFTRVRGYLIAVVVVVFGAFGAFFLWSATAPLARGAHVTGVVSVESSRKTIQHLEGGIVQAIHVRDGSQVAAGDALVEIDSTRARAVVNITRGQLDSALAQRARLIAQRDELPAIEFPAELVSRQADPEVAGILAAHRAAFESELQSFRGQTSLFQEQIALTQREIENLTAQNESNLRQLMLIEVEMQDIRFLVERGLERRPRLLAIEREAARLSGAIEGNNAMIAQSEQSMTERQLQIRQARTTRFEQAVSGLQQVQDRIADLQARLVADEDALRRTAVLAPQNGTVVNLRIHTVGGVVPPGAPILDLVPANDSLVLVVKVNPRDIDVVHQGLEAEVRFSGLNTRTTPTLHGSVTHVSADALQDQAGGEPYFEARITVPAAELARIEDVTIMPGMPVEAVILAGRRTVLEFFIRPITESWRRGSVVD